MRTMIYVFVFLCSLSARAQMKPMHNPEELHKKLAAEATGLKSIACDFTQQKYLNVFDEKVTSKGKFYYQKENKICMNYSQPLDYLIVINGSKLKIVSDGKKNTMNLSANKMMSQMQDMITACMVGDLSGLSSGYRLDYYEDAGHYLIRIKPTAKAVQAYIHQMEIRLSKKDMSVDKLRLSETASDYTEYEFSNKKFNSTIDETVFSVR